MNNELNTQCLYCDTGIGSVHAPTLLLCGHIVHTYCFIYAITQHSLDIGCPVCHLSIVPPSMAEDAHDAAEPQDISGATRSPILQLLDTNPQFKKDVKAYQLQQIKTATAEKKARAVHKQKRREFKHSLTDMKLIVHEKKKETRASIRNSPEYKAYVKEVKTWHAMEKTLNDTYPVIHSVRRLADELHTQRGLSRWPRVYAYPSYLLYCGFRLRV